MNPDLSVLAVIVLLLTCTVLLNTLIFKPVLRVMGARERAVRDSRELAESAAQKAAAAAVEYDRTLGLARADVYRQMDDTRRAALEQRATLLAQTRTDVEHELAQATQRVQAQSSEARARLEQQVGDLAGDILKRVLGRAS